MIIICEPQFAGFAHAKVNAALIAAVRCAFPEDEILFLAEREHLELVNSILKDRRVKIPSREIGVPSRSLRNFRRLPQELRLCRHVFDTARNSAANKVLFASMTSATLISVKVLLRFFDEIQCVVIPHDVLNSVTKRPRLMSLEAPFWLRFWITFGNTRRLRYLVLSPYIEERLSTLLPKIRERVRSVDLPYFFDEEQAFQSLDRDLIRFGLLGVASYSKGTGIFFAMARRILQSSPPSVPEFVVVGPITDRTIKTLEGGSVIVASPNVPLSCEDFATRANSVDYVLFLNRPGAYDLVMSGSLMDAFSYAKPIIALKQPLFDHYFKAMGDIGYLCESYEEIEAQIRDILAHIPTERYLTQKRTILEARKRFSPRAASQVLANLWRP
jgi:hypothetical protein